MRYPPKVNRFERFVGKVAPAFATKLYANRVQFQMLSGGRSYDAANSALTNNRERSSSGGDADRHLDEATLWTLREISRDLDRNNGLSVGLLDRVAENVVGPEGFELKPKTGNEELNKQIVEDWEDWLAVCDGTGEMSGWELFALGYRTEHRDGDIFWSLGERENNGDGALFAIEGDRVFTPQKARIKSRWQIVNGIVMRKNGRREGIWVADRRFSDQYVPVEKGHWVTRGRYIQWRRKRGLSLTRGEPTVTPVIREMDDLDDLLTSERIGAKLVARSGFWIETDSPTGVNEMLRDGRDKDGQAYMLSEPGEIMTGKGKPHSLQSNRPSDNFDPFVKLLNRNIGLPCGLPYELVTLDFSGVNFAASRQLLNQSNRHFRCEQSRSLGSDVSKVQRWWLTRRIQNGHYSKYDKEIKSGSIYRHGWGYPGWASPNPVQDAQAAEIGIRNQFESRTNVNRQRGVPQDQIEQELADEQKSLAPVFGADRDNKQNASALAAVLRAAGNRAAHRFEVLSDGDFDPNDLASDELSDAAELIRLADSLAQSMQGANDAE